MNADQVLNPDHVEESKGILDTLLLPNGLYLASPSVDYSYVWIRDAVYMSLPYMHTTCGRFERTCHSLLDMLRRLEDVKLTHHTKHKPRAWFEYLHSRLTPDLEEIGDHEWGHNQYDAIGAMLWAFANGIKVGRKVIRDQKDLEIIQKLVDYLMCCEFWDDPDHGMWEEWKELHSSSVGACLAGLAEVSGIVNVPNDGFLKAAYTLAALLPRESHDRPVDLAQLSLIYPYTNIGLTNRMKGIIINNVETRLLRSRGVARYEGDSYYSTIDDGRKSPMSAYYGTEAEWTFGLPWLALAHAEIGNIEKAKEYLRWTESVMLPGSILPELYYAGSDKYNPNTPLGWSSALYILARRRVDGME